VILTRWAGRRAATYRRASDRDSKGARSPQRPGPTRTKTHALKPMMMYLAVTTSVSISHKPDHSAVRYRCAAPCERLIDPLCGIF